MVGRVVGARTELPTMAPKIPRGNQMQFANR